MSNDVEIVWTASWDCPKCKNSTDEHEPGVDDHGDSFYVTCGHDIDTGKEEIETCDHEYTVSKRQ